MEVSMQHLVSWVMSPQFFLIIKVYDSMNQIVDFKNFILGWGPIHHAAFCDHVPILRLLYNKHPELLEQTTKDRLVIKEKIQKTRT
jgi:hypothetical protein